jgi:cytidylate kinase
MANIFLDYMTKRAEISLLQNKSTGPIITFSREYGCFATQTAQNLVEVLTHKTKNNWIYVTKEILEESAKELQVTKQEIAHLFGADEKTFLGDLVISFSKKKYATDSNIIKTIQSVVRKYAENGNTIIIGRAGCVIAKDIQHAVHVKLIAPLEVRIKRIKERYDLSYEDARLKVINTDDKRKKFMSFFKGDLPDSELFDLVLNNHKLSEREIIEIIIKLMESRGLIKH